MSRNCNTCKLKTDKENYFKDKTVCKSCYVESRKKDTSSEIETCASHHQPKTDNNNNNDNNPSAVAYENQRLVIFGPNNVDKTYYLLKLLEKIGNKRPVHIRTRSANQYPNFKTKTKIKPRDNYEGSVVFFDDMLGGRNSS